MNIDSFSSSQEFFLHFGIWKSHSKQLTLEPNLGDQNLVKFGTQQGQGSKTVLGSVHIVEQLLFSMFPSILTYYFDLILGPFGRVQKLFWGLLV